MSFDDAAMRTAVLQMVAGAVGITCLGAGVTGIWDGYTRAGVGLVVLGVSLVPVGLRGLYRWRVRKKNGHG